MGTRGRPGHWIIGAGPGQTRGEPKRRENRSRSVGHAVTQFRIRTLGARDAEALFGLRRESLRDAPLAFLASPEDDLAASAEAVGQLLERPGSAVFGAFSETLCGMLGLHRGHHLKAAHRVNLWGLFVRQRCRGQGAGEQLLAAAMAQARTLEGARSIHVSVSGAAPAARRLYERAGFSLWGTEPEAIQFEGRLVSEHHMRLALALPAGSGASLS